MISVVDLNTYPNYNQRTQHYSNPLRGVASYYDYQDIENPTSGNENVNKTLATAGILQVLTIALQKLSKLCGNKLMRGKEFTTFENVEKVANSMLKDNKLNVDVHFINQNNINKFSKSLRQVLIPVAKGENAFYMDSLKLAVAPEKKPSLILHELGHAINASKGKFLKFLQKSRAYTPYVPTAVLLANSMFKNSGTHSDFIEKNAGVIGFLSFLPTIIEEGLASFRGVNAAKKVLGKTVSLKALKRNYFTAWLTYLLAGIGVGVASKMAVLESKTPNNQF